MGNKPSVPTAVHTDKGNKPSVPTDKGNELSVLTGILLDVSCSMRQHVEKRERKPGDRSEKWVNSIFRVMNDLIEKDELWTNHVFAFGVGAFEGSPVFDLLRTLEPITVVNAEAKRYQKYYLHLKLIDQIMDLLKTNGAGNVREWASDAIVASVATHKDVALFRAACEIDGGKFLREAVKHLPHACTRAKKVKLNQPDVSIFKTCFQKFFSVPIKNVGYWGARTFWMSEEKTKKSVEETKVKIQNAWDEMYKEVKKINTNTAILPGSEALKIIKGSVFEDSDQDKELTNKRVDQLTKEVEPYIYGATPLIEALEQAVKVFSAATNNVGSSHDKKLLFVLSDGLPTDGLSAPMEDLKRLGVTVVSCYVTQDHIQARRLYCKPEPDWGRPADFMYDISSTVSTQRIPRTIFVEKRKEIKVDGGLQVENKGKGGWQVDFANNETKLFAQVNHPDMLEEVTQFAIDVVCSQDSLSDVLSSVSLDQLIYEVNDKFEPVEQVGGTCYANAIAAVMYLAMKRIYRREGGYPYYNEADAQECSQNFSRLREEIIAEFGSDSANTKNVLKEMCGRHKLRSRKVGIAGAMKAIANKCPVVATFRLSAAEWSAFDAFYSRNKDGILKKEDLSSKYGEVVGHAVVFTSYNSKGLKFMDSRRRPDRVNDDGFFRIRNHKVLPHLTFFDVYWEEDDLTDSEKRAYAQSGKQVAANLIKKYQALNKAKYSCPLCQATSLVIDYTGNAVRAECPQCHGKFSTAGTEDLALSLYLLSLSDGPDKAENSARSGELSQISLSLVDEPDEAENSAGQSFQDRSQLLDLTSTNEQCRIL